MGELISLAESRKRRNRRRTRAPESRSTRVVFHFDLACPFSHLAAERVDRLMPEAEWRPVFADALVAGDPWGEVDLVSARAIASARKLRVPFVGPDRFPIEGRPAMRAAAYAAQRGAGARFALAAGRLAFCGGFALDDPETLAEAAAAAQLGLGQTLAAARDCGRDTGMAAAGRRLLARGADRLPVVAVGPRLFCGEERVAEAAAAAASCRARVIAM
jgi:2-hydroxychromene-2-carboxylate isomerase